MNKLTFKLQQHEPFASSRACAEELGKLLNNHTPFIDIVKS